MTVVEIGLGVLIVGLLGSMDWRPSYPVDGKERGKVTVLLVAGAVREFIRLLVPACRTIYKSFFIDTP